MAIRIDWDAEALDDLLNSVEGPVGMLLAELSARAAIVATSVVHVRPGTPASATTGRTSNARPPGFTKARIRVHGPVIGSRGRLYAGVNAPMDPSVFLEMPAEQMHQEYPFLTTGLWSLVGTF
jgi:hypothetical protein